MTDDLIPWDELTESDRRNFAGMLNRRFDADVSVEEAAAYYGNTEKVREEFGEQATDGGPECPECFSTLYRQDIPVLIRTGRCPNCGEVLLTNV